MEANMAFADIDDIKEYEPDILNFGISNFDDALTKAQLDVERILRIRWWPTQQIGRYDITIIGTFTEMDADLLDPSQLTRATVYCALGYYIYPRLSKFEPDLDVFQVKMDHYKKLYAEEIDLVIQDGVHYDIDRDSTYSNTEKEPTYFLRLKR
jgi:hypothetical protein